MFGYSVLVAVVLPTPRELVLAVPIDLGLSPSVTVALVIGCSSLGKAIGSVVALRIGGGMLRFGPIDALAERLPPAPSIIDPNRRPDHVRRYGCVGLVVVLAILFVPDPAVVYGFSVIRTNTLKSGFAAFLGTVFRLLAVVGAVEAVLTTFYLYYTTDHIENYFPVWALADILSIYKCISVIYSKIPHLER